MKRIPLTNWAARHYDPAPSIHTLRRWAREGLLPGAQLVGREWYVPESVTYTPKPRAPRLPPLTVLQSNDPIVQAIIGGKTPQPIPA